MAKSSLSHSMALPSNCLQRHIPVPVTVRMDAKLVEWMFLDFYSLNRLVILTDRLHLAEDLLMVGAIGVDSSGRKQPLSGRGRDGECRRGSGLARPLYRTGPVQDVCRIFVVGGARAPSRLFPRVPGADSPRIAPSPVTGILPSGRADPAHSCRPPRYCHPVNLFENVQRPLPLRHVNAEGKEGGRIPEVHR